MEKSFFEQYGTLIGTSIASATALFIAVGGRWLRSKFYKSKLKVVDFKKFAQKRDEDTSLLIVWRIVIKNCGNETAKNVQADVTKIYDNEIKRPGFLPVPLKWTHLDNESRNILPGQTVYLDLFDEIHSFLPRAMEIRLCTRFGLDIRKFTFLENGKANLKIAIFQKNGSKLNIAIRAEKELKNDDAFFKARLVLLEKRKSKWQDLVNKYSPWPVG
jgi:gas vesicle protein